MGTAANTAARTARLLGRTIDVIGQAAAWLMLALVLLVAGNVLGRYLLGISSVAAQELEWHLLVPIALLGMAYGIRRGGHVRVDVFYEHFGPRLQASVDLLTALLTLLFAVVAIQLSIPYAEQAYRIGEGSPDPGGLPHRFIIKSCLPLGFLLLALQAVQMTLESGLRLTGHSIEDRAASG
jgi:TRAP-type mannitol/chloroaromatic compound transport system permease small subunit